MRFSLLPQGDLPLADEGWRALGGRALHDAPRSAFSGVRFWPLRAVGLALDWRQAECPERMINPAAWSVGSARTAISRRPAKQAMPPR